MATTHQGPRVVLIGPPGSGKTTVAGHLARTWGADHRDTDDDVEHLAGKPVSDIFVTDGEPAFRALERDAVVSAVRDHDGVLSLGGGAVLDATSREALADYAAGGGTVVFLDVSLAHAAPRVGFNRSRPLLLGNPRAKWQALMNERRSVYENVATTTVLTDDQTPEQVAATIAAEIDQTNAEATSSPKEEK